MNCIICDVDRWCANANECVNCCNDNGNNDVRCKQPIPAPDRRDNRFDDCCCWMVDGVWNAEFGDNDNVVVVVVFLLFEFEFDLSFDDDIFIMTPTESGSNVCSYGDGCIIWDIFGSCDLLVIRIPFCCILLCKTKIKSNQKKMIGKIALHLLLFIIIIFQKVSKKSSKVIRYGLIMMMMIYEPHTSTFDQTPKWLANDNDDDKQVCFRLNKFFYFYATDR